MNKKKYFENVLYYRKSIVIAGLHKMCFTTGKVQ